MAITPAIAGVAAAGIGAYGSMSAANSQKHAAQNAADTQLNMYNQTRQDLLPFMQGGANAFSNLSSLLGYNGTANTSGMLSALEQYPGYQFALDQGTQALDRSAASRGLLLSGGQLKDLTAYGQGMGSQLFNNYFNQNQQLASLGENAAAQTGNIGNAAAANAGSAQMAAGTAAASGTSALTNAITGQNGILSNALQAYNVMYPSQVTQSPSLNNLAASNYSSLPSSWLPSTSWTP